MLRQTFRVPAADGTPLYTYLWQPDAPGLGRAIVHIVHGMAEHAGRYDPAARHLTAAGYAVVAHDHRGHGRSAAHLSQLGHIGDDGFEKMVDDIGAVHAWTQRHLPQRPVFLLGHSMGSFLTLRYLERGARGLADTLDPRALRLIPHDLPMYLFSGARDPVGGRGLRGLRRLIAALRRHGVRDLTVRIYPGGRHEMLQETNRDEVLRDLVAWLDRHMP